MSVIPTKQAFDKIAEATRRTLGSGDPLPGKRNSRNITSQPKFVMSDQSYPQGTTNATFTIYAVDFATELGTLENVHCPFGDYPAGAKTWACKANGVWFLPSRECHVGTSTTTTTGA